MYSFGSKKKSKRSKGTSARNAGKKHRIDILNLNKHIYMLSSALVRQMEVHTRPQRYKYLGGGKMHSESLIRPLVISRPLAPDDTFIFLCDWFGYEAKHIIRLSFVSLLESPYVSAATCRCADGVIVSCTVDC